MFTFKISKTCFLQNIFLFFMVILITISDSINVKIKMYWKLIESVFLKMFNYVLCNVFLI